MRTVIMSVGTSLYNNMRNILVAEGNPSPEVDRYLSLVYDKAQQARQVVLPEERKRLAGDIVKAAMGMKRALEPDLLSEGPKDAAVRHLVQAYDEAQRVRQSMPIDQRKEFEAGLVDAAAETHTLLRMPLRSPDQDRLVWLASETKEGRWCADVLHALYSHKGYDSEVREIKRLSNSSEQRFAREGLRSLVTEAMDIIRDAGGPQNVVICGTGGWKAEIAYLNLIGLLRHIEVYYIYETFKKVILLPRLPLSWNANWVHKHQQFLNSLADGRTLPIQEVEEYQHKQPRGEREDLEQLFADNEDGTASLTPAGEAIYQAYLDSTARRPHA